jgi:hypothetical protein
MNNINSHDIFDNIIARRCIEAKNIFFEVENIAGIKGFAEKRIMAEQAIFLSDYTLEDIYSTMSVLFDVDEETLTNLKELEITTEFTNAIPILNNIESVNHGDLLISDMYLPKSVIKKMIKKAGLKKHAELILTTHGKSSKEIWPILKSKISLRKHKGDNAHSDYSSPNEFEIDSTITRDHELTDHEKFLRNNGFEYLARFSRELRLTHNTASDGKSKLNIKNLQFQNNIPLLIMTAFEIHKTAKSNEIDKVLFSSRDCYYLYTIFNEIFDDMHSEYFYTSRISRTKCSVDYMNYFKSIITKNSMVVDLCGTGWSLGILYKKLNVQPITFLLHSLTQSELIESEYNNIAEFTPPHHSFSIVTDRNFNNSILEMCNYTTHGMVTDVTYFEKINQFTPSFENPEYPPHVLEVTKIIEECQNNSANLIKKFKSNLINEFNIHSEKTPVMIHELYKDMILKADVLSDLSEYHFKQDNSTMKNLKRI